MAESDWTPSLCSSLTSSDNRVHTPDCWEVCDWSDDSDAREQQVFPDESTWDACEWSSAQSDESSSGDYRRGMSVTKLLPTRRKSSTASASLRVDLSASPLSSGSYLTASARRDVPSLSPVRRSPRRPKPKSKFDPCRAVKNEEGWQLTSVMQLQGCQSRCASQVHGISEYDVLVAHSAFVSKTAADKRAWLLEYFANNCPNTPDGGKDIKHMQFIVCGKTVCQAVWQAVLSLSNSRFYDLRKDFLDGERADRTVRVRSLSSKSLEAVAWMKSYFDRVGDKRPDKDGIYLPTCLSEKTMYNMMVADNATRESPVCFSQFNKLYRNHFPNVTIPKVSYTVLLHL